MYELFLKGMLVGIGVVILLFVGAAWGHREARAGRERVPGHRVLIERLEDQSLNILRLVDPVNEHCASHPSSVWLDIQLTEHSGTTMCLGCLEDLSIAAQVAMRARYSIHA